MNRFSSFFSQLSPRTRWAYALTMPWFAVLFSYLLIGDGYWQRWQIFAGATLLNAAILTVTFFTQSQVSDAITRRYGRLDQTLRRVLITLLAHTVLSAIFLGMIAGLYVYFRLFGSTVEFATLVKVYLFNLVAMMLTVGLYETFHSLSQWQKHQVNKEKLRKENLQGQLQSLKSQVNPHFLFNSLNSLSSMIADEPERAEQFVDEMARVYRYLLQTNRHEDAASGDELTTLDTELRFIESYYHLLKTRHGTGLHLSLNVSDRYRHHGLPPLTLQLLVENAVKHNVILANRPLHVEIRTTDDGHLQVRNNLQKKTSRVISTQIGLANISAKYRLLGQTEPVIESGPDFFTVTLPLFGD